MVHFIHTSDWHLGYVQYHRKERFDDYFITANKTIDRIIELNPNFVLHTGDLFHHTKPSPGTIRLTITLLRKLRDANIPMYIIRGNHDARSTAAMQYGGTALRLLDYMEYIHYVEDTTITIGENVKLTGIGHYISNKAKQQISDLTQIDTNSFRILALHNYIEGQLKDLFDISMSQLSELQYDYIAVGHYHIPWKNEEYGIWVPGSSEATSSNDWRRDDVEDGISGYSSFYSVVAEQSNQWNVQVTEEKITVRPKIELEIKSTAKTGEELIEEIKQHVQVKLDLIGERFTDTILPKQRQPILKLSVESDLPVVEIGKFSQETIEKEMGLLHADISIETEYTTQIDQSVEIVSGQIGKILQDIAEEYPLLSDDTEVNDLLDKTYDIMQLLAERPKSRDYQDEELDSLIAIVEAGK